MFRVLHDRSWVFVLVGPEVEAIVTRADLSKPPARIYLFGLLSLLEMHLTFWIRQEWGEEGWLEKINKKRIAAARKVQANRQAVGQDV